MEVKIERSTPIAAFMAFGTKGDVYPIAAVATAFACDQRKYDVVFITHSAHQDIAAHLAESNVRYAPISSPPVLPPPESNEDDDNSLALSFSIHKRTVTWEHRQECLSIMERIFGDGPSLDGDFVLINFFALEGWTLAELFHVKCVVAAPYVVNYTAPSSFQRQFRRELPLLYRYLQEASDVELGWKDVMHWMWPLFSEDWGSWREELNLSPLPFTDPVTASEKNSSINSENISLNDGISLYNDHMFCFSGSLPYSWLFQKCAIAIHHGGSGATAAALKAGIPQVICPFMLDQFYWAERMCWLGVAPEPLRRNQLLPENCDNVSVSEGANVLKKAIKRAMSPGIKARAQEISKRISQENGVSEAVRILKEEIS
uniref:Erythromycin biosynthesis protein CIII-like C-terminal domain-containing protein n=1 Tax=Chenopodium quinoa TaxID=63459 RepID=A0A803MIH7_CHEQI